MEILSEGLFRIMTSMSGSAFCRRDNPDEFA